MHPANLSLFLFICTSCLQLLSHLGCACDTMQHLFILHALVQEGIAWSCWTWFFMCHFFHDWKDACSFLSIPSDSKIPVIGMWWPALLFLCWSTYNIFVILFISLKLLFVILTIALLLVQYWYIICGKIIAVICSRLPTFSQIINSYSKFGKPHYIYCIGNGSLEDWVFLIFVGWHQWC